MGIYDREYYRESTRNYWSDWFSQRATVWLIVVTTAVYFFQIVTRGTVDSGLDALSAWGEFDVQRIWKGEVWRFFTPMFLHHPHMPLHLIFNMLALYWFGSEIERVYGTREFLAFYLSAGVLVEVGEFAIRSTGLLPQVPSLGASGAVAAALVLFACHFPHRELRVYFLLPVPAWLLVIVLLAIDAFGVLGAVPDRVNHAAHLLGAAIGGAYFITQPRVSTLFAPIFGLFGRRAAPRPRLRLVPVEEPPSSPPRVVAEAAPAPRPAAAVVDEQFEAQLDNVLEKVARTGRDSLTAGERDLLNRASELYKRRRAEGG